MFLFGQEINELGSRIFFYLQGIFKHFGGPGDCAVRTTG